MSFKNFYKIKFNKKILFLFFIFLLSFTQKVSAAELNLIPSFSTYEVGDNIKVRVSLSSGSTSVNAVSSNIKFSTDTLTMTSISKAGSVVSLWAVEPTYSNTSGAVSFEGVMLSGYTGSGGTVLTLNFKAKAAGNATNSFSGASVLANDGEGTNVLTRSGSASFKITKPVEKKVEEKNIEKPVETKNTTKVENTPTSSLKLDLVLPTIQIQKISSDDSIESFAVFNINSVGKKIKSSYKVEIDGTPYVWENQDSSVFTTPKLTKGDHRLLVSMDTINGDILSSSVSFSILSIPAPVITEYSENINEGSYIVIKGTADPDVDVTLVINYKSQDSEELKKQETVVHSDEQGKFIYLSDKVYAGAYDVYAYYKVKSGFESEKSHPVKVNVNSENKILLNKVTNTFSIVILVIALLILLLIIATWGWYKFLNYKEKHAKKLADSKAVISKSFEILDDDVNKQMRIFKKIKSLEPLTKEEKAFLKEFKKDIRAAEKVISEEVKEIKSK